MTIWTRVKGLVPNEAFTSRPLRIHEITPDFRVEDVWALPTPGGPDDFPLVLSIYGSAGSPGSYGGLIARLVWGARWKLGEWFGWDGEQRRGYLSRVKSLRERMPEDLRHGPVGPVNKNIPFNNLYQTKDEFAAEYASFFVHSVMHLSWVPDDAGSDGYHAQMAVLVKPKGLIGKAYMAFDKPFRLLIIYPDMLRYYDQEWRALKGRQ